MVVTKILNCTENRKSKSVHLFEWYAFSFLNNTNEVVGDKLAGLGVLFVQSGSVLMVQKFISLHVGSTI